MTLSEQYHHLWESALARFNKGAFEIDSLIDDKADKRFGVTLLARPQEEVKDKVNAFLGELRKIAPDQYYYPPSDMHVTIMSIISCYQGFELEDIQVSEYIAALEKLVRDVKSFEIAFSGITASPSAIMIQGFPKGDALQNFRDSLRACFKKSGLQQSLDQRYKLETAHITVARFRKPLVQPLTFLNKLKAYRNHHFGTSKIEQYEFVYNDWYQRKEQVKVLSHFKTKEAH